MKTVVLLVFSTAMAVAGCKETAAPPQVAPATEATHYFDERGEPLLEWNVVWSKLEAVFGSSTPSRITLRRFSGDGGRFDGVSHTITVSDSVDGDHLLEVVAHESSHLSMYDLTRGASGTEPFRFFDEGYSDLVGKKIAGENMANHKRSSLAIANQELNAKGVSFETVQHWSDYAGDHPNPKQRYAYPVGSSFVYFVTDSFGEKKLFDFFRDIGKTTDLDTSCRNIFNLTAVEVEQRWKHYLATSVPPEPPLAITEMFPSNDASDIPVDVAELHVTFNTPMMRDQVCVSTPCRDTGICYKNASWKDDRTLVIRADAKLKPGTTYKLELSSGEHGCQLTSEGGAPLPATRWVFTTNKQT